MLSKQVPSPSLIFTYAVILLLAVVVALSACGGGGGGDSVAGNGDAGAGWVTVKYPTSAPTYQLEADSISLSGTAFISPDSSCCSEYALDTGVEVTWTNETTGLDGGAYQDLYCVVILGFPVCEHSWHASVPLALGANVIRVTASDSSGNIGRDAITVTRFDITPPTVSAISPTANQMDVALNTVISATFSEEINNATVDSSTFVLRDAASVPVLGMVTYSNKTATFAPSLNLAANTTYTATLTGAIKDAAGHALTPYSWNFTTGPGPDVIAPVVSSTSPANGAACVSIDSPINADFSEDMDANSIDDSTFTLHDSGGSPVSGKVTYSGVTANLLPYSKLKFSTFYTTTLTTGAKDLAGNSMLTDHSWSFTTMLAQDGTWQQTFPSGAPSWRSGHSAIWTGVEMVVWGGSGNPRYLDTGGRYNPLTRSWVETSTAAAASPRSNHTAVWTGSEMIVWGGHPAICCDVPGTGARYDPLTDTWVATSTTNAPSARRGHTAIWTGSEMLVWGGVDGKNQRVDTGARYDPATDSWLAITTVDAPSARSGHTAVWTGSEMIVWGGQDNKGARYDPASDTWQPVSSVGAPSSRYGHTAVWTGNEMIVWGGSRLGSGPFSPGARYAPSTDTWQPVTTECAPPPRHGHTAVWTGDRMIIWGGYDGRYFNSGGAYDPSSDMWVATPLLSAPSARSGHTAVWTGIEMIIWGNSHTETVGGASTGASYTP